MNVVVVLCERNINGVPWKD